MSNSNRLDTSVPVRLVPVRIAKPWGAEIWFTGLEERGESQVETSAGRIGIGAYLDAIDLLHDGRAGVLLLKVLDPKPAEVAGDLYFEVHEQKQEVYVVTGIDPTAWPDGRGGIRFGMNQNARANYDDDDAFREAFLRAVTEYERIRRAIDEEGASIAPHTEARARSHMNSFTAMRSLRVGDVVRVPTWTPHSLQHGVRVVEFQTPTYERYIISFAQQVLTQDHWDTEHAVARMSLDAPVPEQFEQVAEGIERIARFNDFNVWRVNLDAAGGASAPSNLPYLVAMCIDGAARIGPLELTAEQACLCPPGALARLPMSGTGRLLLAAPGL